LYAETRCTRGNKDDYSGAHVERFLGINTFAVNRLAVFDELIRNEDEIYLSRCRSNVLIY
jgi:hypothetical protein